MFSTGYNTSARLARNRLLHCTGAVVGHCSCSRAGCWRTFSSYRRGGHNLHDRRTFWAILGVSVAIMRIQSREGKIEEPHSVE